ncbi:MAG: hypothetical protein NT154_08000, partial [Verrucomicrobia bacterium]|nr:hypothetical protein [Verrucomicrobiota bacterium]
GFGAFHIFEGGVHGYNAFAGSIDDIRIYNRALSDSEVQQLRNYQMLWMAGWEGSLGVLKPTKKKCPNTTRHKKSSMKRIVSQP